MGRLLGEELKRRRLAKGLSIRELAHAIRTPHTTYVAYERGVAAPPSERREALARVLEVPLSALDDLIEEDAYEVFLRSRALSQEGKAAVREFLRFVRQREKDQHRPPR